MSPTSSEITDATEPTPGERIIEGVKEAVAVAKGEQPAARLHINGHTYVPLSELSAALAAGRGEPGVKALTWRDHSYKDDFLWIGSHPYGEYCITKEFEEWPFVVRPFLTKQSNYETFEEAKADVEADYERRIRSALVSAPAEQAIRAPYTNWRGERSDRVFTPIKVWWGSTEWHPEPGLMLKAFDHDKNADRDFAFSGFAAPAEPAEPVLWQRFNPLNGWVDVPQTDIAFYRGEGQEIRALYPGAPPASQDAALREALTEARRWVEANTAQVRGLSDVAAAPGEALLRKINAALAQSAIPAAREPWAEIAEHYLQAMLDAKTTLNSLPMPVSTDGVTSQVWKRISEASDRLHRAHLDTIHKYGPTFLNTAPIAPARDADVALREVLTAARPIVKALIDAEYNVETWGLRQRLAAIDAALSQAGEATGEAETAAREDHEP